MRLTALNLNQLVALDALLQERHVGRAATRLGVTRSAVSHTLRSLRELMGDPLLARVGNDMVLTPYAEEVQTKLRRGLTDLESVVSGRAAFDPSTITDTFTLATQDGIAALLAGPLYQELSRRAPSACLRIQPVEGDDLLGQLSESGVDLAVVPPMLSLEGLRTETTAESSVAVVCRKDHPVIRKRLTLAQYCKVPHAMATLTGKGPGYVDHLLAQHGRTRQVRARVPFLLSLAEIVASSDLIATLPTGVAEFFCEHWPLNMFPCPVPFTMEPVVICWHPRFDADPPHVFFREVVRDATRFVVRGDGPSFDHSPSLRRKKRPA